MERPIDIRVRKLQHAKDLALAQNPVDLPTVAELSAEIQRIRLGRPSDKLDPVTSEYVKRIRLMERGRDANGVSLFRPQQPRD